MAGKHDEVKDNERFSIIVSENKMNRCHVCGSQSSIALHEVFFGSANRAKSKKYGLVVPLCGMHHNLSNEGVHFNGVLDIKLKKEAEKIWIKTYTDVDDPDKVQKFIKTFGKNYLDDDELAEFEPAERI